jgi:hypothetical protein
MKWGLLLVLSSVLGQQAVPNDTSVENLSLPSIKQIAEGVTDTCSWFFLLKSAAQIPSFFGFGGSQATEGEKTRQLNLIASQVPRPLPTFAKAIDIRSPEWIYNFAFYTGFAYCSSYTTARRLARPVPNVQGSLSIEGFRIVTWNAVTQRILFNTLPDIEDGLFYSAVHDTQKLIILTWRGTFQLQGMAANLDSALIPMNTEASAHFMDGDKSNPRCSSNVAGMEFFAGFMKSVDPETLQQVVTVLWGLVNRFPGYSLVINGHSLGGAKAILTAAYVTKFFSKEIPIAAVYTYGMPPPGNTIFNKWLADCIGPEKIVRVVSSNDLVPFSRVSPEVQHAPNVIEVYNPDSNQNVWKQCMGGVGPDCSSAKNTCSQRSWENHARIGGVTFGASMCAPAES